MEITVLFYGVLADVAGTRIKTYVGVESFGDLSMRIIDDFPELAHYNYRICHNKVFTGIPQLSEGDEIALLPPFEGG
jgi:molybdopterin converting factor small subunit